MALTKDQVTRYSRHLVLPEVGVEGQEKLLASSVLCIGAGGLGSPLGLYLAATGIGRLGLVDFDTVDFSNLQRQVIHFTDDVGRPKVESAREKIQKINPDAKVEVYKERLTKDNIMGIIKSYDVIIDGTDNFATRYLTNDACIFANKPNIYGSIFRFEGQTTVFYPGKGPCYRCLYPEPPPPGMVPSCAEGGVLGILPGIIGLIQATEAVKVILGKGDLLVGRLLLYSALEMKFKEVKLRRDPKCPVCGDNPTVKQLIDYEEFCGLGRGGAEGAAAAAHQDITAKELKAWMDGKKKFVLVDVREPEEFEICRIPGSKLIPLASLPQHVHEFSKDEEIVLHCKSGGRSMKALNTLKQYGFKKLHNLKGGITAWADDVDKTVAKY